MSRQGRQRGVLSQGVDRSKSVVVVRDGPAKSEAEGVEHPGTDDVAFFQSGDLAARLGVDQHGVETVGSVVRGDVAQVGGRKCIFLRNLVIGSDREKVFVDDLLSRKRVRSQRLRPARW